MRFNEEFETIFDAALALGRRVGADATVLLLDGSDADWRALRNRAENDKVVVAVERAEQILAATEAGLLATLVELRELPVYDKLSQTLLKAVADEILAPGARVVSLYSGFEARTIDSVSVIDLGDHLGRLTVRDLRQLESRVPLDTLQTVVNLALEIGREGREGKPVGTLFVVGDTRRVRRYCRPVSFDPVKGYSRKERNLKSSRVREGIKEIAQMDGAILVTTDGTVEAASQYIDATAGDLTLPKGFGARHWAAAAISSVTKAVSVAVSESSGTVRIFQDGEVVLRIEPFRRPMKWKDFEREPPVVD